MSNRRPRIDYTDKDYASLRAALLQVAAERFPAWTDPSPNDLGTMLLELFAYLGDALFYNQDRIAAESFLETAVEPRSRVQLLRLIGYELRPPSAASADLTLLFEDGRPSPAPTAILPGAAFKTTAATTGAPVTFQYIQTTAITIDDVNTLKVGYLDARGALTPVSRSGDAPKGSTTYRVYEPLPVVQVDASVANEIVASSDGSARQRYALARAPVIDGTLVVRVNEGDRPAVWTLVPSLLESLGGDTSYAVRRDEDGIVWIEFGDGTYGKAPARGLNNITASYCVGGGVKGNVPAGVISKPVTRIDLLKLILNAKAASGGAEAEAPADAIVRGPAQLRAAGRAVTAGDFEALTTKYGVAKVLATSTTWNNVELVVAPLGGNYASDVFKNDLLSYLDTKRMMTTLVTIHDPVYVAVIVEALVYYEPQYSTVLVQQQVMNAVAALLSFDAVDFGQILYVSKIYEVMQDVPGVAGVEIRTFARADTLKPADPSTWSPADGRLVFGVRSTRELPSWGAFTVVTALPDLPTGTSNLSMAASPHG